METKQKFTNRLIKETSPYLLQHAHNPVDWYSWCEEAFERAKKEDKPVLVSIGYSACHWCHVMERESFEDEETAKIMNENFINIKVDMEERPDIDQIYMTFVQATTGNGGWPLNVFVTPDKKPFFGGTYFPPQDRYNLPSFRRVLMAVAEAWRKNKEQLIESADEIVKQIESAIKTEVKLSELNTKISDVAFEKLLKFYDVKNGGFGGAPKFPPSMTLEFLMRYYKRTENKSALEIVANTCRKMASGGIYDHIGGGFHRYSVDAVWLVPHFEKMLYDNAQLARIYLHIFQITGEEFFKNKAMETLEYLRREMLSQEGGFYSTQDADSEGEEGKFFLWTFDEIEDLLGKEDAQIFCFYYGITEDGNFEGKNILNTRYTPEEAAEILKISTEKLLESIQKGKQILFAHRETRIKPFRDEKILLSWNGLALATFAEASRILDRPEYLQIAEKNANFLLKNFRVDGRLLHVFKDGFAKLNAYIEDYANFADGLLELFQVSGNVDYLKEAKKLVDEMIKKFWDEKDGGFFSTSHDHEQLILRLKEFQDNATPSGNSVAAGVLLKLAEITSSSEYEKYAVSILKQSMSQAIRYPNAFGYALSVLEFYLNPVKEIVVLGEKNNPLIKLIWQVYLPNKVVILSNEKSDSSNLIPLLEGKKLIEGKPTAYVCSNGTCKKPTTDVEELKSQLLAT
jgi:uncharacterized protein YyaL (SSP411 family)